MSDSAASPDYVPVRPNGLTGSPSEAFHGGGAAAEALRGGSSNRSDADLVAGARRGDRQATNTLFANHLKALYSYILCRVDRNTADAEDVLQETVTAAVAALPRYRRDSGFWAWLTAIARHKATDHLRSAVARGRRIRAAGGREADLERVARSLASESVTREAEDSEEVRAAVAQTMSALELDDQALLFAKYRDGRSVAALAGQRGCSEKAVESMLYRARERFRQVFAALAASDRARRRGPESVR